MEIWHCKNHGSHYGFIENGVVFSKLQPGLATIFVLDDGSVEMKTWAEADNQLLAAGSSMLARTACRSLNSISAPSRRSPALWCSRWGPGNWSGSEDMKLRTMRAGAALQTECREALPDLRRVLRCHTFGDGSRLSGLPVRLRHAPGHERSRTHLSGALSTGRDRSCSSITW